ncbi:bifunctional 4-hydroxyphenylacetate degradation enzyme [Fusarium sp. NRRL 52700]|nr:bifunctional 4-hydroxyphenylacetate degradation enzyme [Fusarium sp. NRRL 52700]
MGNDSPSFLQPGETVSVSVPGLSTLPYKIGTAENLYRTFQRVPSNPPFHNMNLAKTLDAGVDLARLKSNAIEYQRNGSGYFQIVLHGLDVHILTSPLISKPSLFENNSLHLFDLEGHGL